MTKKTPQSNDELAKAISYLGELKRKINKITTGADEKISRIQEGVSEKILPLEKEVIDTLDGIYSYAESNRDHLTEFGKTKTFTVPTGKIMWRTTPPKVSIRDADTVIKTLKKLGLERLIRTKEEIDKTAVLKERQVSESVKGISITQREEFVVSPTELSEEIIRRLPNKK